MISAEYYHLHEARCQDEVQNKRHEREPDGVYLAKQVAAAAEVSQAEDSSALSALAESGFSNSSAMATAVHNCRYRPYIARQVSNSSVHASSSCGWYVWITLVLLT